MTMASATQGQEGLDSEAAGDAPGEEDLRKDGEGFADERRVEMSAVMIQRSATANCEVAGPHEEE